MTKPCNLNRVFSYYTMYQNTNTMRKAKYVKEITVQDPDTGGDVELAIYKHENGGMFAIDCSFLEQVARINEDDNYLIPDPLCDIEDDVLDTITLIE